MIVSYKSQFQTSTKNLDILTPAQHDLGSIPLRLMNNPN